VVREDVILRGFEHVGRGDLLDVRRVGIEVVESEVAELDPVERAQAITGRFVLQRKLPR